MDRSVLMALGVLFFAGVVVLLYRWMRRKRTDKVTTWLAALACWHMFNTTERTRAEWVETVLQQVRAGELAEPAVGKRYLAWQLSYLEVFAIRQCGLNRFAPEDWGEVDDLFLGIMKRWLIDVHETIAGLERHKDLLEANVEYMDVYNRMVLGGGRTPDFQDFIVSVAKRVWGSESVDIRFCMQLAGYYTGVLDGGMAVMGGMELVSDETYSTRGAAVRKLDQGTGDVWVGPQGWAAFPDKDWFISDMKYLTGAPRITIRSWPSGGLIETFETSHEDAV